MSEDPSTKSNRYLLRPPGPRVNPVRGTLLGELRIAMRTKHYSYRTEDAYVSWVKRFISFNHNKHPRETGVAEINAFLKDLAVGRNAAASTQSQALAALLFLFREVLRLQLPSLGHVVRADGGACGLGVVEWDLHGGWLLIVRGRYG